MSWSNVNVRISIYFLIAQPAELIGLSSKLGCIALVLTPAQLWRWILGAGPRPEDLAEDTGAATQVSARPPPEEPTHVLFSGCLSKAKCKERRFLL